MIDMPAAPTPHGPPDVRPPRQAALREAARAMEAQFLSVMLQSAGLGAPREAFGGGIGEAQFASFLAQAHADALVARGGIGLAESIFNALKDRAHVSE